MISLTTSERRRAVFTARAREADIPWSFFDAVSTLAPGLVHDETAVLKATGRPLQRGEIGCYSSHFTLWQHLESDDAKQYIILEDDVIVEWNLLNIIAQHDFSASGHHYIRLFQKRQTPFVLRRNRFIIPNGSLSQLLDHPYGTQGYVITREGAARMRKACERVVRPIDNQMDRYWEHGIPNLAFFPFPIMEEFVPSTIGNERFTTHLTTVKGQKMANMVDTLKRRSANLSIYLSHAVRRGLKLINRNWCGS